MQHPHSFTRSLTAAAYSTSESYPVASFDRPLSSIFPSPFTLSLSSFVFSQKEYRRQYSSQEYSILGVGVPVPGPWRRCRNSPRSLGDGVPPSPALLLFFFFGFRSAHINN